MSTSGDVSKDIYQLMDNLYPLPADRPELPMTDAQRKKILDKRAAVIAERAGFKARHIAGLHKRSYTFMRKGVKYSVTGWKVLKKVKNGALTHDPLRGNVLELYVQASALSGKELPLGPDMLRKLPAANPFLFVNPPLAVTNKSGAIVVSPERAVREMIVSAVIASASARGWRG